MRFGSDKFSQLLKCVPIAFIIALGMRGKKGAILTILHIGSATKIVAEELSNDTEFNIFHTQGRKETATVCLA